jgi:medium-chain acyl-[acyl-carrier-protein] hydrolase
VEVCAVQPPGREGRYGEPLFTDLPALSRALADGLVPLLDRPFAFFGHSLGALVAYETVRALGRDRHVAPVLLALSGHREPHLPPTHPPIHHLPRPAFLAELQRLNGTPEEVLANAELLDLVLPPLRADLAMAETYAPPPGGDLTCPVLAIGSLADDRVSPATLEPWRGITTGPFELVMLPGDHFYLKTHRAALLDLLAARLSGLMR